MKIPMNNTASHNGAIGHLTVTVNGVCLISYGSNEMQVGHKCYDPMTARQLESSIIHAYQEGIKHGAKLFQNEADTLALTAKALSECDFS